MVFPKATYADLILPLALGKLFTYRIPDAVTDLQPGQRVVVQFGKTKMYTALVYRLHNDKPEFYQAKEIIEVLDSMPVVNENQFRLWEWLSEYYLCTLGEIMVAALPAVMKLQSESVVSLNESFDLEGVLFTAEEQQVIDLLKERNTCTIADASKASGTKNGLRLIRSMTDKGILVAGEEIGEKYQSRRVKYVQFTAAARSDDFLQTIFEQLEKKAPKQLDLLMTYIRITSEKESDVVPRTVLLKAAGVNSGVLQQLCDKNVFEVFEDDESRAYVKPADLKIKMQLSEAQQTACEQIRTSFVQEKVVLLHGVTSSGKTEVFIQLMHEAIAQNKQVLYLLPEIALTTQIIGRLKNHFGERLQVYHSRFSGKERAEVYSRVLADGADGTFKYPIIIGARSAVFLPLRQPGLIIVDEEHDSSYKQFDPAPRYHARDTAIVCGFLNKSNVILGSATPSMESYFNAESGKYTLVKMTERYGGIKMPLIRVKDLKEAHLKKEMKSHFSTDLLNGIKETLSAHQQVILFQNRRGFAPVLECKNCGWIPQCINCDVSLTYHKKSNQLRCHYCGYSTYPPGKCLACNDPDIRMKGLGTERIEDEISLFFPDHRIERFDLDTTSSKASFQRILSGFENGEIDILVGTQMVTKGLDFEKVNLVGVLNADHLINFPDFRSAERSYQLLAQVAGRAGRRSKQGQVLIQTYQVQHPVIRFVMQNDFRGFYNYELQERKRFNYPPFCRLIEMRLKMKSEADLEYLSVELTRELKRVFGSRVLGPVAPSVARIRNYYIRTILLKIEKSLADHKVKEMISKVTDRFLSHEEHRSLIIHIDVDPA